MVMPGGLVVSTYTSGAQPNREVVPGISRLRPERLVAERRDARDRGFDIGRGDHDDRVLQVTMDALSAASPSLGASTRSAWSSLNRICSSIADIPVSIDAPALEGTGDLAGPHRLSMPPAGL
jgi:hypothetical protein